MSVGSKLFLSFLLRVGQTIGSTCSSWSLLIGSACCCSYSIKGWSSGYSYSTFAAFYSPFYMSTTSSFGSVGRLGEAGRSSFGFSTTDSFSFRRDFLGIALLRGLLLSATKWLSSQCTTASLSKHSMNSSKVISLALLETFLKMFITLTLGTSYFIRPQTSIVVSWKSRRNTKNLSSVICTFSYSKRSKVMCLPTRNMCVQQCVKISRRCTILSSVISEVGCNFKSCSLLRRDYRRYPSCYCSSVVRSVRVSYSYNIDTASRMCCRYLFSSVASCSSLLISLIIFCRARVNLKRKRL